jgi:hypothetical protein
MKRFFLVVVLISFLAIVGLLSSKSFFSSYVNTDTLANRIGCRLFEFNLINAEVLSNLDLNKVLITTNDKIVFKDGKQIGKVGQYYGHVVFEIFYNDKQLAELGHWRRNNWYTNHYNFKIEQGAHNLRLSCDVEGPDAMHEYFLKRYIYNDYGSLYSIEFVNKHDSIYRTEYK